MVEIIGYYLPYDEQTPSKIRNQNLPIHLKVGFEVDSNKIDWLILYLYCLFIENKYMLFAQILRSVVYDSNLTIVPSKYFIAKVVKKVI